VTSVATARVLTARRLADPDCSDDGLSALGAEQWALVNAYRHVETYIMRNLLKYGDNIKTIFRSVNTYQSLEYSVFVFA
jgi:hypothetical protein